jgi:uncharacterized protein (DUF2062 family)
MMASLREKLRGLLQAGSSNHEIALGLAVGVGISFFPIYGPQMLACLALVVVFRKLNKLAVFLGVQLSWLYPLVVYADYQVGRLLVPGERRAISLAEIREKGFPYLVSLVKELFPVLLAGFVVAGAAAAVVTYLVTRALLAKYRTWAT